MKKSKTDINEVICRDLCGEDQRCFEECLGELEVEPERVEELAIEIYEGFEYEEDEEEYYY